MMRIKEAREARGWTQEQLANALGTTQQTIYRWETGAVDPQASKVMAISEALGITVSYIMGYDKKSQNVDTDDEQELIALYREMTAQQRDAMLAVARAMVG